MKDNFRERRWWVFLGVSVFLILVLASTLLFLIFREEKLPENGVLVDASVLEGEELNAETLKYLNELFNKEPVLLQLPLTVEYFSDDYSDYTKYILSYGLDDSERGFYLIMKDYTSEGMYAGIAKLTEMGMNTVGLELRYEDLSDDGMGAHAE